MLIRLHDFQTAVRRLLSAYDRQAQLICCIGAVVVGFHGGMICPQELCWLIAAGAAAPVARPVPPLIAAAGEPAVRRYSEFFLVSLTNAHTRRAYARACRSFFQWCGHRGLQIETIRPHDVSAYVQTMSSELSPQSVRQSLAAIRMLFDWLVDGRIVLGNPGSSVRGPKAPADGGTICVLTAAEWRRLVDRIPVAAPRDLRDRALITTLTYTFARVSAALALRVEDFRRCGPGWELWLHEKDGRRHVCPCHRELVEALRRYIDVAALAGVGSSYLFRTSRGRCAETLSDLPMTQADAWRMIQRRALAAGLSTPIGCDTFRATGISNYLANGGMLETAQTLAGHKSPRTTKRYDLSQKPRLDDEVERIRF